mgnify:CR=1 FL=1
MIIAIDGPAAAGKGTLARRLAAHLGLRYLDTGSIYRAVAAKLLGEGGRPDDAVAAVTAARALQAADLERADLRTEAVGRAASQVAALPEVREALLLFQRDFARQPPGAVLDGRDIGTVVCPDADVKLFVTAGLEERARRRHQELIVRGERPIYARVLADLQDRDARDAERAAAPLRPAEDAHLLDTTALDADAAFSAALALVADRSGPRRARDQR